MKPRAFSNPNSSAPSLTSSAQSITALLFYFIILLFFVVVSTQLFRVHTQKTGATGSRNAGLLKIRPLRLAGGSQGH